MGNEMLTALDYRRQIKEEKDKGNLIFTRAANDKRALTADEQKEVEARNTAIDRIDGEMAGFMRLNRISEDMLRNYNPQLPNPEKAVAEHKDLKRAAFFDFVRNGTNGMMPEHRALVENTAGLNMVPEDLEAEIYIGLPQLNVMRQICRIRSTMRDKVSKRSLTDVTGGWGKLETGTAITESTPTPSKESIYVEDLNGLVKIGKDELMDTDDNLANTLVDAFRIYFANEECKKFTIGAGHNSGEPDGVTLDATIISTYTDLDTADICVPDDLLDIEYGLPSQYDNGAAFLMHKNTGLQVRKVKATNGPYLWQPSLQVGMPQGFDGYNVYFQNDMVVPASTNTDRSIVAVFGNWKQYMIVDRLGMQVEILRELYAEAGMIGFLAHHRVGGGVLRADAFRALDNNT